MHDVLFVLRRNRVPLDIKLELERSLASTANDLSSIIFDHQVVGALIEVDLGDEREVLALPRHGHVLVSLSIVDVETHLVDTLGVLVDARIEHLADAFDLEFER